MKNLLEDIRDKEKLTEFVKEHKDLLIRVALVAVAVIAAFFVFAPSDAEESEGNPDSDSNTAVVETEPETTKIIVDIGGEVVSPMVAELDEGSRVADAIEAAGGVTKNADLTDINRAAFIEDGEKIYIPALPSEENESDDGGGSGTSSGYSDGKININTADSEELQELSGVGPATAQKIIDYRKENGRFSSIEDIKNVSGIGDKSFEKIKDMIKT